MKISKVLQKRIKKVVKEEIDIVSYDPRWIDRFSEEAEFLKKSFLP